jgi:hypothetical protein
LTSIAAFPQPIHGTATKDSLPRIAIAAMVNDEGEISLLAIDTDGRLETLEVNTWQPEFTVGLRYDPRSETWIDVSSSATEDEEE